MTARTQSSSTWLVVSVALVRALVLWLALALGSGSAVAQHTPADVPAGWGDVTAIPRLSEPPVDYLTERRGNVTWTFHAAATSEARDLQEYFGDAWVRIEDDLGAPIDDTLVIRIARNPEEMHALAPIGYPPPAYASGVAYPRFGVILLSLTAPESWERPNMESLLTHELSHVALYRAVRGHSVPRWFTEGLAVYQAGEFGLDRAKTLWSAAVAGNVVPLDELDARFPDRPHRVNVAYAQSADMVAFMRRGPRDERSFRILIRHLGEGASFREAVPESYDATLGTLERRWRESVAERFQTMPLIVSGTGLWIVLSFLLVIAYVRRRRRHRERLAQWAEREAAEEEALARAERAVADQLRARDEPPPEPEPEDDGIRILVPDEPPQGREPGVPTIEYEGRNHTLH